MIETSLTTFQALRILSGNVDKADVNTTTYTIPVNSVEFENLLLRLFNCLEAIDLWQKDMKAFTNEWLNNTKLITVKRYFFGLIRKTEIIPANEPIKGNFHYKVHRATGPRFFDMTTGWYACLKSSNSDLQVAGLRHSQIIQMITGDFAEVRPLYDRLITAQQNGIRMIAFGHRDLNVIMALNFIDVLFTNPKWEEYLKSFFYQESDGEYNGSYDDWF